MSKENMTPIELGQCEVCGKKVIVAKWISEIVKPTTCSRECGEKAAKAKRMEAAK